MTFPFPTFCPAATNRLVLIDRTLGSAFGDMTGKQGVSAAFDGITNQSSNNSAGQFNYPHRFVGRTLVGPTVFGRAVVYGSNDNGFAGTGNPSVTLTIYGKNGAPPFAYNDGTALGSITFTDTNDESAGRTIDSTDLLTAWDHLFVSVSVSANNWLYVSELVLYAWE